MIGLPEHARRAALAAAHLERRHPKDALIAAEAVRRELGEDYLGSTADGWLPQIRSALKGLSLSTPRSVRTRLRVIAGGGKRTSRRRRAALKLVPENAGA